MLVYQRLIPTTKHSIWESAITWSNQDHPASIFDLMLLFPSDISCFLHNFTYQIGTRNVVHFWSLSLGQEQFNVGKTMPFAPSPSHHHVYRWYVYHSQSWVVYGIVLPTLSQTQERGWHRSHPPSIMEGSHCQTQSVTQWPFPPIGKILIHNIKKKVLVGLPENGERRHERISIYFG
jgi:hypothetical protein